MVTTKKPNEPVGDLDEEDWDYQYDLLAPDKVVIADDQNAYQLFGDTIFSAPQEDLLESELFDQPQGATLLMPVVRFLCRAGLPEIEHFGSGAAQHERRGRRFSQSGRDACPHPRASTAVLARTYPHEDVRVIFVAQQRQTFHCEDVRQAHGHEDPSVRWEDGFQEPGCFRGCETTRAGAYRAVAGWQ